MLQTSDSDSEYSRAPTKTKNEGFTVRAVMCMAGSWAILLIIGAQLSWGNMSTYIASYYYWKSDEKQAVSCQQFMIVQPLIVFTATIFFPLGTHLSAQYNPKM